jgi:hypothetical protein
MALTVLRNIQRNCEGVWGEGEPEGLAHEMFREMLCTAELCDYGTSPRVCFANEPFKALLPQLIEKWEAYSAAQWA